MRVLLVALALTLVPVPAQAAPAVPDLAQLRAELQASTDRAEALAGALEAAAARDGGLRAALEDLAQQSDAAQARLDARVRQVFMRGGPDPLAALVVRVGSPVVPRTARAGLSAAVRAERDLVDDVAAQSGRARVLQARAAAYRARLRGQAASVLAEQDRARSLLATAEAGARRRAAEQQDRETAQQQEQDLQALAVVRQELDAVSASVTRSLSPAQTARGRRAQEREAPLIALAEAAGPGYPEGYGPTGATVEGLASWYGPGFVGSPTATGAPYDPERLTCAHKSLPLGTLLRVTRGDRSVVCLVNDRGPYVGPRVLDLSRAGSRALGYDGVAEVRAEVLAPR